MEARATGIAEFAPSAGKGLARCLLPLRAALCWHLLNVKELAFRRDL